MDWPSRRDPRRESFECLNRFGHSQDAHASAPFCEPCLAICRRSGQRKSSDSGYRFPLAGDHNLLTPLRKVNQSPQCCVLVEAKAVMEILPIHKAQLLSYMKLLDVPIGLLINFNEIKLTAGVHRLILAGADAP